MKLIYTYLNFLDLKISPPTLLLCPLLGVTIANKEDVDEGRFDGYMHIAHTLFKITKDPRIADFFVFPFDWEPGFEEKKEVVLFFQKAEHLGKKVFVFHNSDDEIFLPFFNAEIFQTSAVNDFRSQNVHGYPAISVDFIGSYTHSFFQLKKDPIPSVSYCGYVDYITSIDYLLNLQKKKKAKNLQIGPGLRGKAVRNLLKNSMVNTSFILRKGFWARGLNREDARAEYAKNLLNSPYSLIVRGAGNFSYRLYEALSCGRIPLFVNTKCVLPFDEFINWKEYMVWVEEEDIEHISSILIDFHKKISPEDFKLYQRKSRELYEQWIRPEAFFSKLSLYLPET